MCRRRHHNRHHNRHYNRRNHDVHDAFSDWAFTTWAHNWSSPHNSPHSVSTAFSRGCSHQGRSHLSRRELEKQTIVLQRMFPNYSPNFIRACLEQETSNHTQRVANKLSEMANPGSSVNTRREETQKLPTEDDAPPPYEEAVSTVPVNESNQRPSYGEYISTDDWHINHDGNHHGLSVRNLFDKLTSSPVDKAYSKRLSTWARPVPQTFQQRVLSRSYNVLTKEGHSILSGFKEEYPSSELTLHDINPSDWNSFIEGLNSVIGIRTITELPILGRRKLICLGWNILVKRIVDKEQIAITVNKVRDYISRWNQNFFVPRNITVEFVEANTPAHRLRRKGRDVHYLLVRSC
ncbi:2092_t:CDS:1 [Paraglomus brasilianum]|uniref:2092_t:CDS:1 n=1 Tax=Paraglomus brasilianum TaxID=144538 RepID=A0A9N9CQB7_9GLOM|nr:2092_t:CDS:1 [Paraglomus brasilianum]